MLEYACFDFECMGAAGMKCSSLSEFLKFVDQFRMKNIECFAEKIANDITEGLSYLHKEGYVHRDLKPSNILISNQHYADITDNMEREKAMKEKPLICKLQILVSPDREFYAR